MGMQLCFLISRLALWTHNLISQLTLYDTPRAKEISAPLPPLKNAVKQHPMLRTKRNPFSSDPSTNCRVPLWRIENRELRVENRVEENISNQFFIAFTVRWGRRRRKRLKNQLTIHLKKLQTHSKDTFFPTLRSDAVELGFSSALRERER